MSDETTPATEEQLSFWDEHRFMLLIIGTLVIALVLVSVSIIIYKVSGSAQLDLSRPGYQSVSNKVDRTNLVTDYSAFGPVNKNTVNDFTTIYDSQAAKAKAVDAFNGDPLNPAVLEFSDPTASTE
ncbi:MAG: divTM7 [Candidatus Saccharibacteria bacterium]|nr:divTM7 [Candidatus Saccharibacteria bacterium]